MQYDIVSSQGRVEFLAETDDGSVLLEIAVHQASRQLVNSLISMVKVAELKFHVGGIGHDWATVPPPLKPRNPGEDFALDAIC